MKRKNLKDSPEGEGFIPIARTINIVNQHENFYRNGLGEQLLSARLQDRIEKYWGTTVLADKPELILSSICPHKTFADAFGEALTFWHSVSLTAWFFCSGQMTRTTPVEMHEYYRKSTGFLNSIGYAVPPMLFNKLADIERRIDGRRDEAEFAGPDYGYSMEGYGSLSEEIYFEMRDIITTYRERWATLHLDSYLERNLRGDLKEFATRFTRHVAQHNRLPSIASIFKWGATVCNDWFGGDIAQACFAIGECSPVEARRAFRRMPERRHAFARSVFDKLVQCVDSHNKASIEDPDDGNPLAMNGYYPASDLASYSVKAMQLAELHDRIPEISDFDKKTREILRNAAGQLTKTTSCNTVGDVWELFQLLLLR